MSSLKPVCACLVASLALLVAAAGCGKQEPAPAAAPAAAAEPAAAEPTAAAAPAAAADEDTPKLPVETETVALDQGKSQIPATIVVPKGCTTFNDTPTTIRVDYGEDDMLFGVQVKAGNEFNTDLKQFAGELAENKYGVTNVIVEQTDTLLLWTASSDGRKPNHNFRLLTELAGKTWVCTQGNSGGWSREEVDRQIAACRTLTAK